MKDVQEDEIKIPVNRYSLCFTKSKKGLEISYQKKARIIVYSQLKTILIVFNMVIIPMFLFIIYQYYQYGMKNNSNSDSLSKRRNTSMMHVFPLLIVSYNLEYFLVRYWRRFTKFRGMIIIIETFVLLGHNCTLFTEKDVFGAGGLLFIVSIYLCAERFTYSWITSTISISVGITAMFTYLYIKNIDVALTTIFSFIILSCILIFISRIAEQQRRREYFILDSSRQREREWERVLTNIPLGFLIHTAQNKLNILSPNTSAREINPYALPSLTEVKFSNPALKCMLRGNAHDNSPIINLSNQDFPQNIPDYTSQNMAEDILDNCSDDTLIKEFLDQILSGELSPDSQIMDDGELNKEIIKYKIQNGSVLELRIGTINIIFRGRESVGIIIEDLTVINKIEREKVSREFQSRMVRTITHDIRTPLNLINGSVEILESLSEGRTKEMQSIYVRSIKSGVRCLLEFVECMLKLSKYGETQKIPLQCKSFDMRSLLQDFGSIFQLEVERKGINLEVNLEDDFPELIHQDPVAISQLLFILTSNSVKYTLRGLISLHINYHYQTKTIQIQVLDTGIGIPEEQQEHLFKLYGNVEVRNKNTEFGTGVGLTLCNAIIESMEGSIRLISRPDMGTKIYIDIPAENSKVLVTEESLFLREGEFRNVEEGSVVPSLLTYTSQYKTSKNLFAQSDGVNLISFSRFSQGQEECKLNCPQILIVDDAQSNIFILNGLLGKILGLKADGAINGVEALDKVKETAARRKCCQNYSLILMDCNMPIMNGYEATKQIRLLIRENEIRNCLIVAVTAYDSPENENLCYEAGMDYVLTKPVSINNIKMLFKTFNIFTHTFT